MLSSTILQTKLLIPPLRLNYVHRPDLVEKLNSGLEGKLALISAPAGYGKTTLAVEWLQGLEHEIAWVSLDESDNDPVRFISYVIAALQQVQAGIGETTQLLIQSPQPPTHEAVLTTLLNDIVSIPSPFILALDDYHIIQALPVHQYLEFLVEHQPPQMHLIILTREDPPLSYTRLRGRGQLVEIRQNDLRFSSQECADFIGNVMGLKLEHGQIDSLARRTEGWIAGLQMAALSLRGRNDMDDFIQAFTGSSHYILDYLLEEVFKHQSTEVQDFLLKTSILARLSGPLCDAVAEIANSQELLEILEQANLFIVSLDQTRTWFRYHRLFSDLLQQRLQHSAGYSISQLHRAATRWYAENGFVIEAMRHALIMKDWDEVKLLISSATAQVIREGQLATLIGWSESIPGDEVNNDYRLATFRAWVYLMMGQFQEISSIVDLADSLIPVDALEMDWAVLFTLRSYLTLAQQDIPATIQWASKALEICEKSDPYGLNGAALTNLAKAQMFSSNLDDASQAFRKLAHMGHETGHKLTEVSSLGNLASICNLQGKRLEALGIGDQMLHISTDSRGRVLPLAILAYMTLGSLHLESNELEKSHQCWMQALGLSKKYKQHAWMISCMLELACLEQILGNVDASNVMIQEVHQFSSAYSFPNLDAQIAGYEADLAMRSGNQVVVERWAEVSGFSPEDVPNSLHEMDYLTFARLLVKQKRLDEAESLLLKFERFADTGGRIRTLISVHIMQAMIHQFRNHTAQAKELLEKALILAAPEGYLRAFLEDGLPLIALLPKAGHVAPAFVKSLLTAFGEQGERINLYQTQPLVEPLSDREMEVLQFLAEGLSNRKISERLYVTVGTVKSHVHHILEKLDCNSRMQAVAKAKEIGLL